MSPLLVIPVFIPHQGCPHQCIFCNQNIISGVDARQGQTLPDAQAIHRVIQAYLPYQGRRPRVELAFFGGNFLGLGTREISELMAAAKPWMDKGLVHGIRCSTRPDTITQERLDLVQPMGMSLVEIGVQSMDPGLLWQSGRGHTPEQTVEAVRLLRAAGMGVGVQVMTGLPGETRVALYRSTQRVADLKPDLARIYPVLVLAGSGLARAYRDGRYQPLTLGEAIERVKQMKSMLEAARVSVVRMGLQAGEMVADPGHCLAGPWHPAFGHLVFSALMYDRACGQIDEYLTRSGRGKKGDSETRPAKISLVVHPRSESRLRGNQNQNMKQLARVYPGIEFSIARDTALAMDRVTVKALP